MQKTFPTIYKKASTGALQQWTISVDGNVIKTDHGQIDGAIQTATDTVKEGKNIGRANATTPEEQAAAEAESKWTKKLKKDYVLTIEEAKAGGSSDLVKGGILPMLAHKYRDHAKKIEWPAYTQPKLDGHRCCAIIDGAGKCTLWARSRAQIVSVPHIVAAVEEMGLKDTVLDGELYNHAYKDNFEEITHLIKRDSPCQGHEAVQYHIYDAAISGAFKDRWTFIAEKLSAWAIKRFGSAVVDVADNPTPLVAVQTIMVADEAEMLRIVQTDDNSFLEQGYEGGMLRNANSPYHNKKCYDLQKVKLYDDDEFVVTDVKEGRGKLAGKAIFICQIPDDFPNPKAAQGARFDAKMKGKIADLKQYWDDPSLAIGRVVTVQYQGFTNKERVPRFPVVLRFRQDL